MSQTSVSTLIGVKYFKNYFLFSELSVFLKEKMKTEIE